MVAGYIVKNIQDHMPPKWPERFGMPWAAIEQAAREPESPTSQTRLDMFGEYRAAVTLCETQAAATVCTVLRAWRDIADLGNAEHPGRDKLANRLRDHLRLVWGLRLSAPPPARVIPTVAQRTTRRYDLLPPDVRELGA